MPCFSIGTLKFTSEPCPGACRSQVADDLRHVYRVQPFDRLDFDNERPIDEQIDPLLTHDAVPR